MDKIGVYFWAWLFGPAMIAFERRRLCYGNAGVSVGWAITVVPLISSNRYNTGYDRMVFSQFS